MVQDPIGGVVPQGVPKGSKEGSQRGPKRVPKGSKEGPKGPKKGSKMGQKIGPKVVKIGPKVVSKSAGFRLKWLKKGQKRRQKLSIFRPENGHFLTTFWSFSGQKLARFRPKTGFWSKKGVEKVSIFGHLF